MSDTELLLKEIAGLPADALAQVFKLVEQLKRRPEVSKSFAPLASDDGPPLRQSCRNMEEAIAASERRREATKTDPSVYSLKPWYGILEHSKAWGKHVDAAAEIRKMRDEWPDYWDTDEDT
jgi:hypothetical protein